MAMEFNPAAQVAENLAEHFRTLNQPAEISVSRNLSRQVSMLMRLSHREVEINCRRARDNQRIKELNQVVEHHPEA